MMVLTTLALAAMLLSLAGLSQRAGNRQGYVPSPVIARLKR
ncbi:hypothetical protein [Rhizobium sp. LC145]|nr:hypothetical protein [Rhizobium sp. LC145]